MTTPIQEIFSRSLNPHGLDRGRLPRRVVMAENLVWDTGVRVGSHHYAKCITTRWGADVLWIALPWTPFHLLSRGKPARARRAAWAAGRGVAPGPKLRVLSPLSLIQYRNSPFCRSHRVARLSLRLTLPSLRRSIEQLGFSRADVLWITDPRHANLIDWIKPARVIYRCPDHFQHFSDIPRSIERLERQVVERADVVVASSEALVTHLRSLGADAQYVPNGVDPELFASPVPSARLETIPSPRILYAGAMGEWFDWRVMRELATRHPSYSVVLAGPLRADIGDLLDLPNVHYLGSLPYEDMPGLMAAADIGVVPFRAGGIGAAVNPIKMFEYLAAGLPVVMTGIGDDGGVGKIVSIAADADEFVSEIDRLLERKHSDPTFIDTLRACARKHSWDARFDRICAALDLASGRQCA